MSGFGRARARGVPFPRVEGMKTRGHGPLSLNEQVSPGTSGTAKSSGKKTTPLGEASSTVSSARPRSPTSQDSSSDTEMLCITPKKRPRNQRSKHDLEKRGWNAHYVSISDMDGKQIDFFQNAVLKIEHEYRLREDTVEKTSLIIRDAVKVRNFAEILDTEVIHHDRKLWIELECEDEAKQRLSMRIVFAEPQKLEFWEVLKQLNGNTTQNLSTLATFHPDVASSNDPLEKDLIGQACRIAERYINTQMAKSVITEKFGVPLRLFQSNMKEIRVEFRSESDALSDEEEEEGDEAESDEEEPGSILAPVSWIRRRDSKTVCINDMFASRWTIADKHEKQTIIFAVAMCILHEIAHCSVQWTQNKNFERDEKQLAYTPPSCNYEAGRYLEYILFGKKLVTVQKITGKITNVAVDNCPHHLNSNNCDCDPITRYEKINYDFIRKTCQDRVSQSSLLDLDLTGRRGISQDEVVRNSLLYADPVKEPHDRSILPNEVVRELCGTQKHYAEIKQETAHKVQKTESKLV